MAASKDLFETHPFLRFCKVRIGPCISRTGILGQAEKTNQIRRKSYKTHFALLEGTLSPLSFPWLFALCQGLLPQW